MGGAGEDSAGGPPTSWGLRCSNTLLVSVACSRPKCGRVAGSTSGTQRESVAFSDVFILFYSFKHATVACCYTSCQTGMLLWSHPKYLLTTCYLFCFSDLVLGFSEEFCAFSMAAETCPGLARALNWQIEGHVLSNRYSKVRMQNVFLAMLKTKMLSIERWKFADLHLQVLLRAVKPKLVRTCRATFLNKGYSPTLLQAAA